MSIVLSLPYPISANRYWRSFVPRGGSRAIVTVSDEAKAYKQDVAWRAKAAGLRLPLDGRVAVRIRLYPARPQDWAKRCQRDPDTWDDDVRCIDLGNCEKVLSDALNGVAWVDDKQLWHIEQKRCEPDEKGARVEVEIEPIKRQAIAPSLFEEVL
jgi:crossover junction endodeoxyribonuclease RusA